MPGVTVAQLDECNQDGENLQNEKAIENLGGLAGLERGLDTSFSRGLTILGDADVKARQELYGANEFPAPEPKTWVAMFLESFEDTTVIVLCVSAVVSLAVGLWEDYTKNTSKGWIEGAAILFAVVLVAVVTATNNYNKENQFRKLNNKKDDVEVSVFRNGEVKRISCKALVVGDVCKMEAGDKVPADALLISGSDVSANESALTGEPEDVKKTTTSVKVSAGGDPFLISGSTLSTGTCTALIIATGANSRWGKSKSKLEKDAPATPLQEKLETLANQIGYLGMAMAACTFVAMVYMWWAYPLSREEGQSLTDIVLEAFIMAVTIVVVAVPEGLPLAVTLSLAYSTQKMMDDNNLIRVLEACETMGNATNICSDKTGTLTQNRMTVVECWVAGSRFTELPTASQLPKEVVSVLSEGLAVNSTADLLKVDGQTNVKGSKTEGALLMMLQSVLGVDYVQKRIDSFVPARGDQLFTFSSLRKRMSVLLLNGSSAGAAGAAEEGKPKRASLRGAVSAILGGSDKPNSPGRGSAGVATLHVKGASEAILDRCTTILSSSGATVTLDAATRRLLSAQISEMAQASLRTIGVAFRSLSSIPATSSSTSSEALADSLETELTFVGLFGIKDPLRPDVPAAVQRCQAAGIFVRMVTGDNIETAQAIARECGILTEGGLAMEGPAFRKLSPAELDRILPTLQVLARSSPDDKHLLVTRLNGNKEHMPQNQGQWEALHPGRSWSKERDLLLPGYAEEWAASRVARGGVGEVVGVTGDGTNDGPALKAADVGLSMGLGGTDVAKEASDIVILDDNFSSIVKAVVWGRSVFDNIRKFLQFQLTVNVVALTITFCAALAKRDPPLNAVMMLWVNLIMDTMGALALGTEPPGDHLLERKPFKRDASLISLPMIRNIAFQSAFQIALLAYLLLLAPSDFNVVTGSTEHYTIIFNTFVLCQVFNEFNARSIGDDVDVFKGLFRNLAFVGIIIFTVAAQVAIVQFGGTFVKTAPLSLETWGRCLLMAALTFPIGGLMRLVPASELKSDYAVLPAILSGKGSASGKDNKKRRGAVESPLTLLLWLVVVAVVPALTYKEFGGMWGKHVLTFAGFLAELEHAPVLVALPEAVRVTVGKAAELLVYVVTNSP